MIAVDASTWIAFFQGDSGEDVELLDRALEDRHVLLVPVVLTEMLIRILPQRSGAMRVKVLSKRRKARLGDALIAQSCIDQGIPLLTRDRDFQAFADAAGLDLVVN